ncbi:hypothetical protein [Mycobacterium sp. TKK-01-0059]|uniref:hypothetical protein n=1 Tax=Mycobacterium sp. TKK-01-0059 TaxID=1324269 RepID=UPI001C54F726|nr:hypothetical protein [Mycobacterium sp. TKK-01-0059]
MQTGITNARTEGYNRWPNRSSVSAADSGIESTRPAGYDSTAPANSGPQPRLHADCPVKIEEPANSGPQPRLHADCPVKIEEPSLHQNTQQRISYFDLKKSAR